MSLGQLAELLRRCETGPKRHREQTPRAVQLGRNEINERNRLAPITPTSGLTPGSCRRVYCPEKIGGRFSMNALTAAL